MNIDEVAVLRIDERCKAPRTTLVLSGSLTSEYIPELEKAMGQVRGAVLNLSRLQSVDREGLAFLAGAMQAGVQIEDCPAYVRRWMAQETWVVS